MGFQGLEEGLLKLQFVLPPLRVELLLKRLSEDLLGRARLDHSSLLRERGPYPRLLGGPSPGPPSRLCCSARRRTAGLRLCMYRRMQSRRMQRRSSWRLGFGALLGSLGLCGVLLFSPVLEAEQMVSVSNTDKRTTRERENDSRQTDKQQRSRLSSASLLLLQRA